MFLTYREIAEVMNSIDKDYQELRSSGNAHQQRVGSMSLFVLRRVRKEINKKIKQKYSKGE